MFWGFTVFKYDKILSDWQPRQVVETDQDFRDRLTPIMETESVTEIWSAVTTIPGVAIGPEGF
jgi:hypothetical protein